MSHTLLLVHIVFATNNRQREFAHSGVRDKLFAYTAGIARNVGCRYACVGGWVDHLHVLVDLPPTRALSDVVRASRPIPAVGTASRRADASFRGKPATVRSVSASR